MIEVDEALLDVGRREPAHVVPAALQDDGVDAASKRSLGQRQVVMQELRLQRARGGRDHHRAPGTRGRDQVREALADPRAGLAYECATVLEGLGDRVRHRPLGGPLAKTGPGSRRADCRLRGIQSGTRTRKVTFEPVVPARPLPAALDRSHEGTHERRTRRDHHRRRPRRLHGGPVCRPRQSPPAGVRGLPGRRPAHDHLGRRQLPRIPRRDPRARAHGPDAQSGRAVRHRVHQRRRDPRGLLRHAAQGLRRRAGVPGPRA